MVDCRAASTSGGPIFISYRRDDCEADAGRLSQSLALALGEAQVFLDTQDVRAGADFVERLDQVLCEASSMLVVIGPAWTAGGRLSNPSDWVRLEVETAIRLGVRVFPLLVRGAGLTAAELPLSMRRLARTQAITAEHSSWDQDLAPLIEELGRSPDASDRSDALGVLRLPEVPEGFIVRNQPALVELDVRAGSCEFSIVHTPKRLRFSTNDSLDTRWRCEMLGRKRWRGERWGADQFKTWTNQSFRLSAGDVQHVGYYASRVSYRRVHGWKLVVDGCVVVSAGEPPPPSIDLVWW